MNFHLELEREVGVLGFRVSEFCECERAPSDCG